MCPTRPTLDQTCPIVNAWCVPPLHAVPESPERSGDGGVGACLHQKLWGDTVALITLHPPFFLSSVRCRSHSLHTSVSALSQTRDGGVGAARGDERGETQELEPMNLCRRASAAKVRTRPVTQLIPSDQRLAVNVQ